MSGEAVSKERDSSEPLIVHSYLVELVVPIPAWKRGIEAAGIVTEMVRQVRTKDFMFRREDIVLEGGEHIARSVTIRMFPFDRDSHRIQGVTEDKELVNKAYALTDRLIEKFAGYVGTTAKVYHEIRQEAQRE